MTELHINIQKKYFPSIDDNPEHPTISNLDFSLNSNEFVCLVGPSGCGKTTLLNIIAGLDKNYLGSIQSGHHQSLPTIGYVFQNPRLLPWRTVRENIELASPNTLSADSINSLLEKMKLTRMQNDYPERLSLGMSRRVSIIRAFAIDPNILLMDEPFVSLDPPTARQVRNLLIELWQQRPHTILFVTHNLREAIALADRIIFLSEQPMRVISEISIPISRNERQNETKIESFRQELLSNYPTIKTLL